MVRTSKTWKVRFVTRSWAKVAAPLLLTLAIASEASGSPLGFAGLALTGSVARPECLEALVIAKAAFTSDSPRLFAPLVLPRTLTSTLVLGATELDISGGDALQVDEATFEKHHAEGTRSVIWQRDGEQGRRLVVQEIPHGWRGDAYTAFIAPEGLTVSDFVARLDQPAQGTSNEEIFSGGWRPPLVFRRDESGPIWLIDVGQPWVFLGAWTVYAVKHGATQSCRIDFRSKTAKDAGALLPRPTAALVRLLDKAIGSGVGEGTLQPTARIRIDVQHVLANAALRPWAIQQPYNSRSEVDVALAEWARQDKYNLRLLQSIGATYPAAEAALAAHYQRSFHLGPTDSKRMAAYALDVAYRSHFVFHKDKRDAADGEREPPNPWHRSNEPRGVR